MTNVIMTLVLSIFNSVLFSSKSIFVARNKKWLAIATASGSNLIFYLTMNKGEYLEAIAYMLGMSVGMWLAFYLINKFTKKESYIGMFYIHAKAEGVIPQIRKECKESNIEILNYGTYAIRVITNDEIESVKLLSIARQHSGVKIALTKLEDLL